jgi:hypothetical protein
MRLVSLYVVNILVLSGCSDGSFNLFGRKSRVVENSDDAILALTKDEGKDETLQLELSPAQEKSMDAGVEKVLLQKKANNPAVVFYAVLAISLTIVLAISLTIMLAAAAATTWVRKRKRRK